jgi:hypothetical protein
MEQEEQLVLEPLLEQSLVCRRKLLPVWIKVFVWIFMIMGTIVPLAFIFSLYGGTFQIALYGLESNTALNIIGATALGLFLFKGIAAFALWTEKDWAVDMAIVDAILGIIVCLFVMMVYPFIDDIEGFTINVRLELLLLIPYLVKLQKIRSLWRQSSISK